MKKSVKLIAAITAAVLTLGIAGCEKNTVYPNFINPETSTSQPETKEKYVINVQSVGGLPLNGVQVNLVSGGSTLKRGLSTNGKIEFAVGLGEYELQVEEKSLPAGYKLPEKTYKTSATSREPITIELPCEIIPASNSAQCTYATSTMMRDFTFTDCNGNPNTLSNILKSKKSSRTQFLVYRLRSLPFGVPAIQRAYNGRDDIEILAICSTHQGDTNTAVSSFKESYNLTFPMGVDTLGLNTAFNVQAFPTTVIIDRYGLIAEKNSGSETNASAWTSLFNKYTADNYVQKYTGSQGGDDNPDPSEREKPNIPMPSSSVLEAAANAEGLSATYRADDDEYSWPWLAGEEDGSTYIYSSNTDKDNSYAIVYADIPMKKDEVLSLEYNVDSEANKDYLHILLDGDLMSGDGFSATDGWVSINLYVADRDRTVELAFVYQKDEADPDTYEGKDVAKIRNINLSDKNAIEKPIDVLRACADGVTEGNLKYDHYTDVALGSDGYYHNTETDALIYISINQLTPWTDMHTSSTTVTGGTTYYSTLYNLTYYNYAVTGSNFNVTIGGLDITKTLQTYWTIQGYMPAPYYLVPLSEDLQKWAQKFTEEYEKKLGSTAHDKEWLEFCFYYDHYGSDNYEHADGEKCYVNEDHTRGLTTRNSFVAYEKNDPEIVKAEKYNPETGRMKAEINYPLQQNRNGTYYEFTATKTGVYQIRSYTRGCSSEGTVPGLSIYNANGDIIDASGYIRDFDQYKGTRYEGFNHYVSLRAGQKVYLMLEDAPATTGHYEFDIEYKGESYEKMFVCSTSAGSWTGNNGEIYLAIDVAYDMATDRYYAADRNGNPNLDKPIYVDMTHHSYMYSDLPEVEFQPLEYFIEHRIFDKYVKGGFLYQTLLENYLAQSKEVDVNDELYGLVEADSTIVNIINAYIDQFVDGGKGAGNGWLTFAVYMKSFG